MNQTDVVFHMIALCNQLRSQYTREQALEWLNTKHQSLANRAPKELINEGNVKAVLQVL